MSIIFTLDDFTKVEKVTMPWAGETYFIPAGTPMSADGIANDGNAIGILAEDARLEYEYDYGTNPYGKVDYTYSIITHGYVNTEDAEASFGGSYSDECRSALNNIVFCDNNKIGGGGGGSNDFNVAFSYDDDGNLVCDKTYEEIYAAISDGKNVHGFEYNDDGSVYLRYDVQGAEEDDMICFIRTRCYYMMGSTWELKVYYRNVWSDNSWEDGDFAIQSTSNPAVIE